MVLAFEANKTWHPMRTKDVPRGTPSFSLGTTLSKKRGTGLEKVRIHVNGQRINDERARRDGGKGAGRGVNRTLSILVACGILRKPLLPSSIRGGQRPCTAPGRH